ncbi:MAG TPA: AMP-binding protein, partial [Beijerinckiaceae bacterium]|nr:AMP-binding protein [Beijerinckiaceae bacterium]
MTSVPEAAGPHIDPLASFDLESLVSGAARLRAERAALGDSTTCIEPVTFAEFDRRVSALAGFWRDLGLQPGERILLAAGATATNVIALFAAMRAGLDAALAPLHLDREEMVDFACRCDAAALAAEAAYGESRPAEDLMGVASRAPRVRFVCSLGGRDIDGAVDADPAKLVAPIEA